MDFIRSNKNYIVYGGCLFIFIVLSVVFISLYATQCQTCVQQKCPDCTFLKYSGIDTDYNDFSADEIRIMNKNNHNLSYEECQQECIKNPKCTDFVHYKNGKRLPLSEEIPRCQLKSINNIDDVVFTNNWHASYSQKKRKFDRYFLSIDMRGSAGDEVVKIIINNKQSPKLVKLNNNIYGISYIFYSMAPITSVKIELINKIQNDTKSMTILYAAIWNDRKPFSVVDKFAKINDREYLYKEQ
jgi:hypothetical protein